MSDTDIPYESGDDAEYGLTPEQREQLRRSMEILSRAIEPIGPKLQSILGPGFNNLAADMLKLPSFRLPESIFKNIAGAKALTDAQSQWVKQLGVINSDVFKGAALAQSNLDSITAQITKNVDFGLSGSFAKGLQQFAAQQSSWLRDLGSTLGRLKASFYPANLREIAGLRLEEVEQVVMVDGIALYNVPRSSIAEALIRADGASGRREILGRRWKAILADCRTAVDDCRTETVAPYVTMAVAALNALDAGHAEAAQALTGSLLDAIVNTYFGMERHHYTPDKSGKRTNAAYDEFGAHQYIAFAPVWQAWQKFFPDEGKPVPHTFSRNATAHTVSAKQFTRRNAVQGLMIVCGILVFLDEQARVVEGRSVD